MGDERHDRVTWLSPPEMAAWLPLVRLVQLLPQQLDHQLREETGINHTYYQILVILSAQPGRRISMSDLADSAAISQSRLSHAIDALQHRGWVIRRPGPEDRRIQLAELTEAGFEVLEQVAPSHVREVRRLVFDPLSARDVDHLARIARKILSALEPQGQAVGAPAAAADGAPAGAD